MTEDEFWAMGSGATLTKDDFWGSGPATLTEDAFWSMGVDSVEPAEKSPYALALEASEAAKAQGIDPYQANIQRGAQMHVENNPRGFLTGNVLSRTAESAVEGAAGRLGSLIGRAASAVGMDTFGEDMVIAGQSMQRSAPAEQALLDKKGVLGETITSWIRQAGSAVGEAGMVGATGAGLPGVAAWFAGTTYDKTLDDTGSHSQALTHGLIEGGFTLLGGKLLGAGTGKLAEKLAGGKASSTLGGRAAEYLASKFPLPKWAAEGIGGAGGEVLEEALTEGSHYLADVALTDKEFDKGEMLSRMRSVVGPSLLAGGMGGTLSRVADVLAERHKQLPAVGAAIDDAQTFAGEKPAAARRVAEGGPLVTSRRPFEKHTGKKETSQTYREAFVAELGRLNDELDREANDATDQGPIPEGVVGGRRSETPPLTTEEKEQLTRDIDALSRRRYTTRRNAAGKAVRDEEWDEYAETIAALHELAKTDPELAYDIVREANQRAGEENERRSTLRSQLDSALSLSDTKPITAGGVVSRGQDETSIKGYDAVTEHMETQWPELAAESRRLGYGDTASGIPRLFAAGRKQFDPVDVGTYAAELLPETESAPASVEPVDAVPKDIERAIKRLGRDLGDDNLSVVEPSNQIENDAAEFVRSRGKRSVFISTNSQQFAGANPSDSRDTVFLRSGMKENALWRAVGHELAHATGFDMRSKADRDLLDEYKARRLEKASPAYRAKMEADPQLAEREAVAEMTGDFLSDPAFRARLARENPSLWQRIRDAVLKVLGKFTPRDAAMREVLAELRGTAVAEGEGVLLSEDAEEGKPLVGEWMVKLGGSKYQAGTPTKMRGEIVPVGRGLADVRGTYTDETGHEQSYSARHRISAIDFTSEADLARQSKNAAKRKREYNRRRRLLRRAGMVRGVNIYALSDEGLAELQKAHEQHAVVWETSNLSEATYIRFNADNGVRQQIRYARHQPVYGASANAEQISEWSELLPTIERLKAQPDRRFVPASEHALQRAADPKLSHWSGDAIRVESAQRNRDKAVAEFGAVLLSEDRPLSERVVAGLKQKFGNAKLRGKTVSVKVGGKTVKVNVAGPLWKLSDTSDAGLEVAEALSDLESFSLSREGAADKTPVVEPYQPERIAPKKGQRQPALEGMPEDLDERVLPGQQGLFLSEEREPTSTKNAVVDVERQRRAVPDAMPVVTESTKQWDADAKATLGRNPNAGRELVEDILDTPRQLSARDNAILLNHQTQLQNEYDGVAAELVKAVDSGNEAAATDLRAREASLSDDLLAIYDAGKLAGTEWGRAGVGRQMMMNNDFSLAAMTTRKRAAVGGRSLTDTEQTQVADLQKQVADLQDKLQQAELAAANKASLETHQRLSSKAKRRKKSALTQKQIVDEMGSDPTQDNLTNTARQLYEKYLHEGFTSRDVIIDKVHADLQQILPDLTRRQTMDAVSRYGQFSEFSKDPIKILLQQHAGEMQQIAKLLDMEAGLAPQKTGKGRPPQSDEYRRLTRVVNEYKRKYNIQPTDPAKQLASALQAVKTRLRNEITDLATQIRQRQKFVKSKTDLKYDAEAQALQARRDALKEEFNAIFGQPGMTDAKRLELATKAVERNIAEYERRIKVGDFATNGRPAIADKNLDALKAKRDSLRQQYQELKAHDPASQVAAEQKATLALQRRLGNQLARLSVRLAIRDFQPKGRKANRPLDEATARFEAALDRLKEKWNNELWADRTKRRLTDELGQLDQQIASGTPALKEPRPTRELPEDLEQLEYQVKRRRKMVQRQRNAQRPKSILQKVGEPLNVVRSLITSFDLSAVLRQGGFITFGHPVRALKAAGKMFQSLVSEKASNRIHEEIHNRANAPLYAKSGLFLSDLDATPSKQEEAYMSRWATKIPGIRQSARAYTTFLNELRADSFDAMAAALTTNGKPTPQEAAAIANFINVATGRGPLGRFEPAGEALATAFFSPRYVVSRFQLLAGQPLAGGSARTRKMIAAEYGRTLAGLAVVYGLAAAAGADLEDDPLSPDFGKLRWGNTRLDPLMGLSQATVLVSREAEQFYKTLTGANRQPFKETDGAKLLGRFLRTKLAPIPGLAVNLAAGSNVVGEPVTVGTAARDTLTPLAFREILAAMEDQGVPRGSALSILQLFGMGLQTYDEKPKKR